MLGDNSLEPLSLDGIEKQDALFRNVIAESYVRDRWEDLFQEFFSPEQGQVRQVMPLKVEEIKDIVEQMTAPAFLIIQEQLEIRMPLVIHHNDLAVQKSLEYKSSQRVCDRGKLFV